MRRRYIWNKAQGRLIEVPLETSTAPRATTVWADLPGYESPVTGKWIEGRKARRDDLARTNCRPYEGREQEVKEAAKARAEQEKKLDTLADKMAHRAWVDAPERIRKIFRSK